MAIDPVEVGLARHLWELDRRMAEDLKREAIREEIEKRFKWAVQETMERINCEENEVYEQFRIFWNERDKEQAHNTDKGW